MLTVKNLVFKDPTTATPMINNLDLQLNSGEFIALVGRKNSGRSTLAKLLNGHLKPESGTIKIDGISIIEKGKPHPCSLIPPKIGIISANPDQQIIGTTVSEDLAFGPENLGLTTTEISTRINFAFRVTGLQHLKAAHPCTLSQGEKIKLVIGGLLVLQPRFLIFDEVTAPLNSADRQEILALIRLLHQKYQIGSINITNQLAEIQEVERVILLDQGCLAFDGQPEIFLRDNPRQILAELSNLEAAPDSEGSPAIKKEPLTTLVKDSFLRLLDPRIKMLAFLLLLGQIMLSQNLLILIGESLSYLFFLKTAQIPWQQLFKSYKLTWPLLLTTTLLLLFSPQGPRIIAFLPITTTGVWQAAIMLCKISLFLSISITFTKTTTSLETLKGIEKLTDSLRFPEKFALLINQIGLMITLALRFVFLILTEAKGITANHPSSEKQPSLNLPGVFEKITIFSKKLLPLFLSWLHRVDEFHWALEARCYHPQRKRSSLQKLQLKTRDFWFGGWVIVSISLLLTAEIFINSR